MIPRKDPLRRITCSPHGKGMRGRKQRLQGSHTFTSRGPLRRTGIGRMVSPIQIRVQDGIEIATDESGNCQVNNIRQVRKESVSHTGFLFGAYRDTKRNLFPSMSISTCKNRPSSSLRTCVKLYTSLTKMATPHRLFEREDEATRKPE